MRVCPGPPEPRWNPPDRGGFTIIELIVVIMLVTFTAAVSLWAYFARPEVTLDNAAQLLVRDMRIAQARAALLHAPVTLAFHEEGDGYRIVDGAEDMAHPRYIPERIERRYSRDAVFEGVSILPIGLAARGRIVFGIEGSDPSSGSITLSYGRATRIVEIEAETGHVLLTGH
jgi:type II secretory pathway pseudopilin PulG